MSLNNIIKLRDRSGLGGIGSRSLKSMLIGGSVVESSTIKTVQTALAFPAYPAGDWPATAAAALAAIGFGTSWDAGYDLDIASGSPTNTFGSTALTAEGVVTYGGDGPLSATDDSVRVETRPPQIRETVNAASGTSNPSTTALTAVGDLVICVFFGQTGAPTVATGFTNIVTPFLGSGSAYMGIAYKVATGAGAAAYAPYTFSGGAASVSLVVLQAGTFDIALLASATAQTNAAAPADPPAVTSYNDGLLLAIGGIDLTTSNSGSITAPTGYLGTTTQSGSSASHHEVTRITTDISSSVDPGTMTWSGAGTVQSWYGVTIAIGPSTNSAGKAASSSPFDVTSGDVAVAWLAYVAEGSTAKSGYIVDKLSATNGYAVELVASSNVPKIKFSADSTALNTVSVDVPRGQWHVGIATYVGSTGVMTLGTLALGGGTANTGTATDAAHAGLTSAETFRLDVGRGDLLVRGLLIGASTTGTRVGTLNTTGNMATALESLRQVVIASPLVNYTLTADSGTFTLTGAATAFFRGLYLSGVSGAYVLTGTAVAFRRALRLASDAGAYVLTGTDVTFRRALRLASDAGAYVLTGTAAGLFRGYTLVAGAGAYTLTGSDAGLRSARVLAAASGAFTMTGVAANLRYARTMTTVGGAYVLAGSDAGLYAGRVLSAGSGTYTLTGTSNVLTFTKIFIVDGGSYTLTGGGVTFAYDHTLAASPGTYTLTGGNATLTHVVPSLSSGWGYRIRPRYPRFGVRIGLKDND